MCSRFMYCERSSTAADCGMVWTTKKREFHYYMCSESLLYVRMYSRLGVWSVNIWWFVIDSDNMRCSEEYMYSHRCSMRWQMLDWDKKCIYGWDATISIVNVLERIISSYSIICFLAYRFDSKMNWDGLRLFSAWLAACVGVLRIGALDI